MSKILWHSNAAHTPTGYGQQTALFLPLLAEHHSVTASAFWGLEGAPIRWKGIEVLPGLGGDWGNDTVPQHATFAFGGDPRGGIVVTLCDVWPLSVEMAKQLNIACWTPVDHMPAPEKVMDFLAQSGAVPIAMSRFGERQLGLLDPLYVPHGVDTEAYRPHDKRKIRQDRFPPGAFVVGMVAANKGHPSRKAFSQALEAFARFAVEHDNAYLYLHTVLDPNIGQGVNIPALIRALGIPLERVRVADQYAMLYRPYPPEDMAKIYSALDVLLSPSFGEGFGVPVLEAHSCGVPAIVTNWTAMPEVCGVGWHVDHHPYWSGLNAWQAIPKIDDIVAALEECHALSPARREKMAQMARKHALDFDARRIVKEYWLPALKAAEQRFSGSSKPVVIPSRLKVAA